MSRISYYQCDSCGKRSDPVDESDTRRPAQWSSLPANTIIAGATYLTGEHVFCSSDCLLRCLAKNGIHPTSPASKEPT